MSVLDLARPEIRRLQPYVTAAQRPASVRLNANELPGAGDPAARRNGLNRYPDVRPTAVEARLAALYAVAAGNLLATRGSSEAIDMLVRTFCRPYTDNIVVTAPSFSMYRVYADIQAADVVTVPLDAAHDFRLDGERLLAACGANSKLVFLCSPNNPTGTLLPADELLALAAARSGRSLIVIDEAYIEFSGQCSLASRVADTDNLVVLRSLSKAHGLAGVRCGALIAQAAVIDLLRRILPPYSFSAPATDCILEHLSRGTASGSSVTLARITGERERLRERLAALRCVRRVWPSAGNFLLVRFDDLQAVQRRLAAARILVREFENDDALADCARVTIGEPHENDALLAALGARGEALACR